MYFTICGDDIVQSPNGYGEYEECDGTDGVGPNQTCTSQCTLEDLPSCGDGTLDPGEQCDDGNNVDGDGCSATCDWQGELIVKKVVIGGTATSSNWLMDISQTYSFPGSFEGTSRLMIPGMHKVTESNGPTDYDLTYSGDCGITGLVSVGTTSPAICILTNTYNPEPPLGSITICKYYDNGIIGTYEIATDTPLIWPFAVSSSTASQPIEVSTDQIAGCVTIDNLPMDTYNITELPNLGGNWVNSFPSGGMHDITLTATSADITVIFLNYQTEVPESRIIVKKIVVGGIATSSDWTMHLSAMPDFPGSETGTATTVVPGVYQVTESGGPANYILSYGEYCDDQGNITAVVGETRTCVLTNTYSPPPYCGDGIVQQGEQCDDGNNVNGDGCSASCTTEGGGGGGGGGYIFLQIMDIKAYCTTEDTAVVEWRTNKSAASWVVYGIDSDDIADATSTETTTKSTQHSATITGLTPEVDYSFTATAREGSQTITKSVTYNTNDCVHVKGEEGEPILSISKVVDKEFVNPGDTGVEYIIVVANEGNLTAFDVVIDDDLPTGLTYAEDGSSSKSWPIGDLAPGEIHEIIYLVNVSEDADPMVYINTAVASASNHGPVSDIANIDIRVVEVLAETGFSMREFGLLIMFALASLGAVSFLKKQIDMSDYKWTYSRKIGY